MKLSELRKMLTQVYYKNSGDDPEVLLCEGPIEPLKKGKEIKHVGVMTSSPVSYVRLLEDGEAEFIQDEPKTKVIISFEQEGD